MSSSIDISGGLLKQVLSDPVEFLRTRQRVEGEFLHVGLDESILWYRGEDVVHQPLVARPERGATAAATWNHKDQIKN